MTQYTKHPITISPITSENIVYAVSSSYRKDWKSIPHTHSFCEIFYITKGRGSLLLDNSKHAISRNDLIIVNPNILHTEISSPDTRLSYIVLGINNLIWDFQTDCPSPNCCIHTCSSTEDQLLLDIFHLILGENRAKKDSSNEILDCCLSALLLKISQVTLHISAPAVQQQAPQECIAIKEFIDASYSQPITLDDLAALSHHSKYYMCHSFSKAYGISPMKYLLEKRILTAKELLSTSDYSVAQVSEMTGFSSSAYFSQIFKRRTGLSPREFRLISQEAPSYI